MVEARRLSEWVDSFGWWPCLVGSKFGNSTIFNFLDFALTLQVERFYVVDTMNIGVPSCFILPSLSFKALFAHRTSHWREGTIFYEMIRQFIRCESCAGL